MKNMFTKLASCLLLAIYIVNPLHASLHAGHVHGSHSGCHAEKHSDAESKFKKSTFSHLHECYLCQNSQDRNHFSSSVEEIQNLTEFTTEIQDRQPDHHLSFSPCFYIDSRGPPALS